MAKHIARVLVETYDDNNNWEMIWLSPTDITDQQNLHVVSTMGGAPNCACTTSESAEKTIFVLDDCYSRIVPGPSLWDYLKLILEKMEAKNG